MHTISAGSVGEALALGLDILSSPMSTSNEASRNGGVTVLNGPMITTYQSPVRRVLFSPKRDANPFFHYFEALWMLGGRNDLEWLAQFNKQMRSYSDDGGRTQPAAYGFRWRDYFGYDQIDAVVEELRLHPESRRAVLAMWDGFKDMGRVRLGSADVPCNTQCFFTIRNGLLNMAVTCRSNDALWGAHGANAVHFSILQEYIAARIGVLMGTLTQFSWNYHIYDGILKHSMRDVIMDLFETDAYESGVVAPVYLFSPDDMELFDEELPHWLQAAAPGGHRYRPTHLALHLADRMLAAWRHHKRGDYMSALASLEPMPHLCDWRLACQQWLERRLAKKEAA